MVCFSYAWAPGIIMWDGYRGLRLQKITGGYVGFKVTEGYVGFRGLRGVSYRRL